MPAYRMPWVRQLLLAALAVATMAAACRKSTAPEPKTPSAPALRLYLATSVAGALEPCGCRKDMLGGVDHAAALVAQGKTEVANSLVVAAGPMFFMNPELTEERRAQDTWKAESIAEALADLKLAAWTPGANDFAAGPEQLSVLLKKSNAQLLGANLKERGKPLAATSLHEVGGRTVGIAGVSAPVFRGSSPANVDVGPLEPALRAALKSLVDQGARINVALVAAPRGEALRLAERVPGFQLFVVGKPADSGAANDGPTPPVMVGDTLVVQSPNHLQALGVVDLYVQGNSVRFTDASGIERAERRRSLQGRIDELTRRIASWEQQGQVSALDLAARKADLSRLKQEFAQLDGAIPRPKGSYFTYTLNEVREGLGKDDRVYARMLNYYRRVNDYNRALFKERKPKPPDAGSSHFVGGQGCVECHQEAYDFWKTTGHAKAYKTLADEFKEFNLDCVSCHVTGYDLPGGSTVTFVDKLKDVQCEACHGAASQHVDKEDAEYITLRPKVDVCKKCHHSPHVLDTWSAADAWQHIVGPGHGEDSEPPPVQQP